MDIDNKDLFEDEENGLDDTKGVGSEVYHIRIQQRSARKTLTVLEGLPVVYDGWKVLKALRKEFACNGTVLTIEEEGKSGKDVQDVQDGRSGKDDKPGKDGQDGQDGQYGKSRKDGKRRKRRKEVKLGKDGKPLPQVIQLQGDHRAAISDFLKKHDVPKANIKVHGF